MKFFKKDVRQEISKSVTAVLGASYCFARSAGLSVSPSEFCDRVKYIMSHTDEDLTVFQEEFTAFLKGN